MKVSREQVVMTSWSLGLLALPLSQLAAIIGFVVCVLLGYRAIPWTVITVAHITIIVGINLFTVPLSLTIISTLLFLATLGLQWKNPFAILVIGGTSICIYLILQSSPSSDGFLLYVISTALVWQLRQKTLLWALVHVGLTFMALLMLPSLHLCLLSFHVILTAIIYIHPRLRRYSVGLLSSLTMVSLWTLPMMNQSHIWMLTLILLIHIALPYVSRHHKTRYAYVAAITTLISAWVLLVQQQSDLNTSMILGAISFSISLVWLVYHSLSIYPRTLHLNQIVSNVVLLACSVPILLHAIFRIPGHRQTLPALYVVYGLVLVRLLIMDALVVGVIFLLLVSAIILAMLFSQTIRDGVFYLLLWVGSFVVLGTVLSSSLNLLVFPLWMWVSLQLWRCNHGEWIFMYVGISSLLLFYPSLTLYLVLCLAISIDRKPIPAIQLR